MASNQAEEGDISKAENNNLSLLDLSKKEILKVAPEILELKHLKYLYLEENMISFLPDNFFIKLSSLLWLDLRHNKLQTLPESIGKHVKLSTLLLEGNQLKSLPSGIGQIKSLTGLSLAGNPLEDPPLAVVNKGVRAIKLYCLRRLKNKEDEYDDDADECSSESGSDEVQHQSSQSVRKPGKQHRERHSTGSTSSRGHSVPTEVAPTEYKPPLPKSAPPLNSAYYGSVLGDVPHSYIIKAWKTGSYFTRQRKTDHKPPAMDE